MFTLIALLGPEAPELSVEQLETDLREFFSPQPNLEIRPFVIPISRVQTTRLTWDGRFSIRFSHIGGEAAQAHVDGCREDAKKGVEIPADVRQVINMLVGNDGEAEYTNQVILATEFLESYPDTVIYDPTQHAFFPR